MPDTPPRGLFRMHRWYPHQQAIDVAVAQDRYWTADDYIDRYLMRVKQAGKQPNSSEWLMWFIDDSAQKMREERSRQQQHQSGTDDSGIPLSWT